MKNALNEMYNQRYTLERFNKSVCSCFADCEAAKYSLECSFICNRSAKVGNQYESSEIRVVFIGKEDTSSHTIKVEEPENFCEQKNQHYIGTKHILAALLGKCSVDAITNYQSKEAFFDGDDKLHEVFALTNHYHCAFKNNEKNHGVKTTAKMWDNCAALVRAELEILCPNVVVIQAGWTAKKGTDSQERINWIKMYFDTEKWSIVEDDEVFGLYIAKNAATNEVCYIIGSYHPSFAKWNQEEYLSPLKKRIIRVRELIENGTAQ